MQRIALDARWPAAKALVLAFLVAGCSGLVAGCSGGAQSSGDGATSAADAVVAQQDVADAVFSDAEQAGSQDAAPVDDSSNGDADLGGVADGDAPAPDAGGPSADPVTLDEYAAQLPGALCAFYARCAPAVAAWKCSEGSRLSDSFRDATASTLELQRALVALGTVGYDANLAGQCLQGYATGPCHVLNPTSDTKLRPPAECSLAFEPLVAAGGSCRRDEECANPAEFYCVGSACVGTGPAQGKCVARPGLDEQCGPPSCGPGLTCVKGYCPFVSCPSGGACREAATVQEGESCDAAHSCGDGLICTGSGCTKPPQVGARCDQLCDPLAASCVMFGGLMDPQNPMPPEAFCVAFGTGKEGDPCGAATCGPGLVCGIDGQNPAGICIKGGVPVGSPCHPGHYGSDCVKGTYCGLATGATVATCLPYNGEGATCETQALASGCSADLRCLGGYTGKCSAGGKIGDPCKNAFDCRSSTVCGPGNTCIPEWACSGGG